MKKILVTILFTCIINIASANSFINEITQLVGSKPEVNINLSTGILKAILAFSGDEDAQKARSTMSGLDKIQVSIYDLNENSDSKGLNRLIKSRVNSLASHGYEQIVSINGRDETVYILAKVDGEYLRDAMLVAMEDDELVIISLDGDVDLKNLAAIADEYDIDIDGVLDI